MQSITNILDAGMLRDSVFPDIERVDLRNRSAAVNYAVLYELAMTASGKGTGLPIEIYYRVAEDGFDTGQFRLNGD